WSIPEDSICFAFVGKLEKKKRVLDFLQALKRARERAPNITGLVVGSGEQLEVADSFVKHWALPVAFTGFLNQTEIFRAYVAADALVLPSNYGETWGLVVNEAMASEIPAIVSDRVGVANDLVIDGQTGLVVPFGDTRTIARGMVLLATDHDARRKMGREGQLLVTADYSIARAVERTRELTSLVLARRNAFA
ncbi:MAG: glycosyltransferase, partial [Terriglobales bacterium]